MSQDVVRTEVLGYESTVRYSRTWAGYALVTMRVMLGWVLLNAGITRLLDPGWSARAIFAAPMPNPLLELWYGIGHTFAYLLEPVVVWGLTVTGIALIFGALVRLSALVGAWLMVVLWTMSFPETGILIIDQHLVNVFVLFGLATFGAGRIAGLDAYFEAHRIVKERPWLRHLLG